MNKHEIAVRTKTTREMLEDPRMKTQLQRAIPKHLDLDRLLRTVMTAIRVNPVLLDCTQESLLAAVMACAQLGLEPEPFLGQAYLVPFKKKGILEVVFIPGYRGYIALARRSGEVQSVSAQVVYENDYFRLMYGTEERLEHIPTDGDRGKPKGAYVIFKYKDGGHSFDYMTTQDINRIRDKFSQQPDGLMWKENWPEGAKKSVIRRHVKLVPLAVEIQRAAALEDRAYGGGSQFDMVFPEGAERPELPAGEDFFEALNDHLVKKGLQPIAPESKSFNEFLEITAEANEMTIDELKGWAIKDLDGFWGQFERWEGRPPEEGKPGVEGAEATPAFPFAKLKTTGLRAWEKEHRDELPQMDKATQTAFMNKWFRVIGTDYPEGVVGGPEQPQEEPESTEPKTQTGGGDSTEEVTCPNTQEVMKISYCNTHCQTREGCPVFE